MLKTNTLVESVLNQNIDNLTQAELNEIVERMSAEHLVEVLQDDFSSKDIAVKLNGMVTGLWFLNNFDCSMTVNRGGEELISLDSADDEATVFIDADNIQEWYKDELSGQVIVTLLNDSQIHIYEQ